jgi:two-component system response regulator YesN
MDTKNRLKRIPSATAELSELKFCRSGGIAMYRILIVDDEPITRNGIKNFIDWKNEFMHVDSVCSNGETALSTLESCPVDILITDIKMPKMNGIELMKKAFELYPWLKVIMISSYSDFDYVREGLKLGAVDYLLKSALEPQELLSVLHRCTFMLEKERRKKAELNYYQNEAVYRERKYIEKEVKRLVVQKQVPLSSIDWAPTWLKQRYDCVYLILDGAEELMENQGYLYVQLLLEDFQELFYREEDEGVAMLMEENSAFLVFPDNVGDTELRLRQWKKSLETELGISLSFGFTIEEGISRIMKGLTNSRMACQRRFFEGLGGIYVWEGLTENKGTAQTSTNKSEPPNWQPFFEIIRNGDPIASAVEYAMERWKSTNLNPEQVKHEAYYLLTDIYERQANTEPPLSEGLDLLKQAETLDKIASLLKRGLEEIKRTFIPKLPDNGNGGQMITKALKYIDDHYTENLTLQIVANTLHVSKNYFSSLFKKQTGCNFIDYLIELRIRVAKKLLTEEGGRIYSIAETVGFNDVRYFIKIFKKLTDLTPLEYREKYKGRNSHFIESVKKNKGVYSKLRKFTLIL